MDVYAERAHLALDTIHLSPTKGIPGWQLYLMEHELIERLADVAPGAYRQRPEQTYIAMQRAAGISMLAQYIPDNPLTMGSHGYEHADGRATTDESTIVRDGILIDSPEAVVEHLERAVFPRLEAAVADFDGDARVREFIEREWEVQHKLGPDILKCGHSEASASDAETIKSGYQFINFPVLDYSTYGYANYFMAYALYPNVMEKHFSLQADLALLNNESVARAYAEGGLPPMNMVSHDMADSRGTLVDVKSLDKIWFPYFARCIEPVVKAGVRIIWHCDGNLMEMLPRLLESGIKGFQGFQYEDGMDYPAICEMKTRDGEGLIILAGVSVTRTMPMGRPADVKKELDWLVEYGPKTGLFLGTSSSIVPGTPWENVEALVEGIRYYQTNGR